MFELSIARRYLFPRWRQLSVSIISSVSILVIALVVWLIVVFFSVKDGLESGWIDRIVALTAPVRLTPTEEYYKSYYYLADSISSESDYTSKTIADKLASPTSDPYNPEEDEEIPSTWPKPEKDPSGHLIDPVKTAFAITSTVPDAHNLQVNDYETASGNIIISTSGHAAAEGQKSHYLEQVVYIGSLDNNTPAIVKALFPLTPEDAGNMAKKFPRVDASSIVVTNSDDGKSLTWPAAGRNGSPILLPKAFRDAGALVGDQGYVSYYSPTPSSVQEQRLPIFVAGFYDPGIMPIGSKYILAPKSLVAEIRGSIAGEDAPISNGINVRFDNIKDAGKVKEELRKAFEEAGIGPYWKIETYQEFEYTKDLIQQLDSEKNLFSLISLIIIIVACSNIISMLIILVNDKKMEIGILRSMGATWVHIAAIFGVCGMVIGATGSLIGIAAAMVTLRYINELVGFMSSVQGHDMFNPVFYGSILPSQMSMEALFMVFVATAVVSLLAGIVPAIKASLLRPSAILRAE